MDPVDLILLVAGGFIALYWAVKAVKWFKRKK